MIVRETVADLCQPSLPSLDFFGFEAQHEAVASKLRLGPSMHGSFAFVRAKTQTGYCH